MRKRTGGSLEQKEESAFQVGEKVVHIPEGVCLIENVVEIEMCNEEKDYYKLVPVMDDTCAIYVSVDGTKKNMRRLRSREEILNILEKQKESKPAWIKDEDKRMAQGKASIQADDGVALAKQIKAYYHKKKMERLRICDNKWLKKAEQLLYSEIAEVLHMDYNKLLARLIKEC